MDWTPVRPRVRPWRILIAWVVSALALLFAAGVVPTAHVNGFGGAVLVSALVGILNAILPPIIAALRLPLTVAVGFLLVLALDAAMLLIVADVAPEAIFVEGAGTALLVALISSAAGMAIGVIAGVDDDAGYAYRVARRVARRTGKPIETDVPGIIFLEIDGLALPVLRRAIRDGTTPHMARWASEGYVLTGWEPDTSSQTGASQAGILLGSNENIPAFRWVEKETGRVVACSNPDDCAEIEERHTSGAGLLLDGGTSRGNLLSGEAGEALLTVSRISADKEPNPGYRAFFANGANVSRTLVLFVWEVILEVVAATRQRRRDVVPRGHRGGTYPFLRAGMCVFVRDLVTFSVLQDMFRGVPAVYATFASYDEVAHHSGLERQDTLEALRKLDQRFAMLADARKYAPRPYEIVVLSDHGQTQGATFKQRNGYGLDELVEKSLSAGKVAGMLGGDENAVGVSHAIDEARGDEPDDAGKEAVPAEKAIVLGSGNLGLVYLMEEPRRLTMEEIDERHPELLGALRSHPHVGFLLVRSSADGAVVLGAEGRIRLSDGVVEGVDPLAPFGPNAAHHLARTDSFEHVADIMVNSFYDPVTDEGCAFEELISFHGGMGGPQTEPFILHPASLPAPGEPLVGAASVNQLLRDWRAQVAGAGVRAPLPAQSGAETVSP